MISASKPPNEHGRLAALARYDIIDSAPETSFDEIVTLIASLCEVPIALVSLVDSDRQWFKSQCGISASETPRDTAFCAHALLSPDRLMIVPDATIDPRFADNPLVTGTPHIRFYAGAPLVTADGYALGTLCIIDTKPRFITPQQEDALRVGSRAVMTLLEQRLIIAELRAATQAQLRVEADLRAEIAQRRLAEERLNYSSSHDGLTRLPNRVEFVAQLDAALARLHATGRRFAVFFIDLDRFKQVNDSLGHSAGDELLVEVGRRLNDVIRAGDAVARLGGDEFTMLIDGADSESTVMAVADRIATVLATKLSLGDSECVITASVGVCLVDDGYTSVQDILRDADIAMYSSKDNGRSRCTIFVPKLRDQFTSANDLHTTLRRAMDEGRFRLAYQPIVPLGSADGRPCAFEALLRLEQEDGSLQSAAAFIEVAEATGLIVELGDWILREACAQAWRWQTERADLIVTTVNVSAKQLAEPNFAARVKSVIAEFGLDPARIAVELTESVLIADVEASLAILAELRDFGVKIYLDDFGTGYSSLSYLRRFPVERIKIDRSFVSGDGEGLVDPVIVNSIISLAHELNLQVVAEGVETQTQCAAITEMGCDWAQGYLFSPAIPARVATALLGIWNTGDMRSVTAA